MRIVCITAQVRIDNTLYTPLVVNLSNISIKGAKRALVRPARRISVLKHGIWFVDIPRTSTTSIRAELASRYGPVYQKAGGPGSFPSHITALEMRSQLGKLVWNRIFKFTIVRNPYSRHLSYYLWGRANGYFKTISYPDFVLDLREQALGRESRFSWHGPWYSNLDYITDEHGELIVDSVIKFENRENELATVAKRIGLKELGTTHVNKHTPIEKHYSEYYDAQSIEIIAELYQRDLEWFGYEFERPGS